MNKRKNIEDIYPLSPTQQGILFHALYAPKSGVYLAQISCTLSGSLNVSALKEAWQLVMERHPVLRTSFRWVSSEQPFQVVYRHVKLPWEQHYWRGVSQQECLKNFLEADRQRDFDLDKPPLMRLALIQLSEENYQFVWSKHHLILDGWSTVLVFKEVFDAYEALHQGDNLPVIHSRAYGDYIAWLRQQDLSAAEAFWRNTLKGFTAPTPLIVNRDFGSTSSGNEDHDEQQIQLSEATTTALHFLAQQHQLTLNTLLQGAFALLLSRYSGEEDIVFGTTSSGRPPTLAGVESMVGVFINTLPARVHVESGEFLLPWLKKLQAQQAQARQYEYSPLVEVQAWSDVPRGMPLFESILVFENYPVNSSLPKQSENLGIREVRFVESINYPLTVVVGVGSELSLKIWYSRQHFDAATITRMLGHLQTLLEGMVANPNQHLKELQLLTEAERHQLLVEWNDTQTDYYQRCIHELFEEQVERSPHAVAVVFEDEQLTYQELNGRANQLACYLQKLGVKQEVLVGICVERSLEMVVGILGILKAGGAYVPLDQAYPQERLAFILQDAQVPVLLTQQQLVKVLPHQTKVVCLDTDWESISQESQENPVRESTADNLAYVIYTSGSTGQPKGVLVNHANVTRLFTATQSWFNFNQQDVWALFHSIAFDFSVWELWGALLYGGRLVVVPYCISRSSKDFYDLLYQQQVTVLNQTPSAFRQLIQTESSLVTVKQLALRLVIFGGEALELQSLKPWFERHTNQSPQLVNMYGITETTVHVTYRPLTRADLSGMGSVIGRPIPDLQVYLLDRHQQPVPIGVPGEMYIGGAGLARGYLHRPELNAEKFIAHPFSNKPDARLYRSGDLARYLPDGDLEYLGRIDHQVKLRGFRIELGEISAALAQHPAVRETVVLICEAQPENKHLLAYIIPKNQQTPKSSELRNFLKKKLPQYMVPSVFVMLEALPLTPNGKIDYRALPEPNVSRPELDEDFVAPRTPVEELLAGIWSQVLNLEQVGIHDNFLELGGHSLLATQVMSRVYKAFQIELSPRCLFELPTIAGLAEHLEMVMKAEPKGVAPPLEPVSRDRNLPLSFSQQRLWFLNQLEPGNPLYNIPGAVRLIGLLNVAALEQSLNEIIKRHEVLRTTLVTVEEQAVQVISSTLTLTIPVVDLRNLPETEREPKIQQLVAEAQRPFDLSQEPLLRVTLLHLGEEDHVLLFTMHHIVSDNWSMGILIRELGELYKAFSLGLRSPLPELSIQYADFAVWQRQWLQGEVLDKQLSYWKQQLADISVLQMPTDYLRSPKHTFTGTKRSLMLPKTLTHALITLSHEEGVTLFMILLAAFQTLLYRYTGQDDIVVGSPIANRNRAEVELLIGFFVNTLVLRTNLSSNPSFRELLRRVRETALGAYAHQDLPFEVLVGELKPSRNLSHTPLFQVWFTLQNAPTTTLDLPSLTLLPLEIESRTAKFDLALLLSETPEGLSGSFEYNTDLFAAATIDRMAEHFETLLQNVVTQPDVKLDTLVEILNKVDKQQRIAEEQEYQKNIHQKLLKRKR